MTRHIRSKRPPMPAICLGVVLALAALLLTHAWTSFADSACPNGSTMAIVAHEDDSLLFQTPDLLHDIQSGRCVRTVFVTAGNAGQGQSYWSSREKGAEATYASLAGVPSTWTQSDAGISGHPMPLMTLSGNPKVSIVFMRLPDSATDGTGNAANFSQSLRALWTRSINQMTAVDGSSSYTEADLVNTLTALMKSFGPDRIDAQDYVGSYGNGDHADHLTTAYLAQQASRAYNAVKHTLVGYMGYPSQNQAPNVTGSDFAAKMNAWLAYAPFDYAVCQTQAACQTSVFWPWLNAQYTTATETDGPGITYPPLALATTTVPNYVSNTDGGPTYMAAQGSTVTLDGSQSLDPDGGTTTYRWTQTAGPTVSLSSSTAAKPNFTAPATNATLTFQLVVSDGSQVSEPTTISISVTPPDLALQATATASSQDLADAEGATKAIDGIVDGYPGDATKEWSTAGGKAGSWLKLTWNTAQTVQQVVLYDRPNSTDQITSGTLTFSDGSTVSVGALNNAGGATVVNFPARNTTSVLLTVNSVASGTQNAGLAEIMVYPAPAGAPVVPTANAGSSQTVNTGSTVLLDGSGSSDPGGNPSYKWTQTSGPAVTLSSSTAVKPSFTAPSSAATLTFQLVVSDGSLSSQPSTVTITVSAPKPPTANAGPNQTVNTGSTVQLDGSGSSDPGGNPSYKWTQTSGPAVTLSSSTAVKPSFTAPSSAATLTFQLVVSDGSLSSQPSTVTITVSAPKPPTANAGPNQAVTPGSTVQLDGSGSSDPGGNPSYKWTQTSGPAVTLSSSTAVKPTFTAPSSATTLTFQLVVSDGSLSSQPSSVTITVTASTVPIANAGPNQSVTTGATVQLDGSGSVDPGGAPVYGWTQTSGYAVTLSSATAVKPTFVAPTAGTYVFQLVVSDGELSSQASTVTITVAAPSNNIAPSATVAASSQNTSTGQSASSAIDGVVDGYPGNYTHEWATNGGGAGSWLKLTWSTAQTVQQVVLYDRPNTADQITSGTLTFSDGSTVSVPSLNNDGSATVVDLTTPVTTTSVQLTVSTVSGTTQNVGLAEIQVFSAAQGTPVIPLANAGSAQTVTPGSTVQLDGSGSSDPGGNPSYKWTQTSGPAVTLSSSTAVKPTFAAPSSAATLTFQLVVSDGSLTSQPSSVTITDAASSIPVANAGPNQSVTTGATVQLDGSGSVDPGGAPVYGWTQTSGYAVTLSSATAVKPTFVAPTAGTYVFQLVVSDMFQVSQTSTVTITVAAPSNNIAPSATVAASSQNTSTGQSASSAIDGVVDGYPGNYTHEWATNGGGAGSWLKLTWSTAQTVQQVVLYDRPNTADQITSGTLTFSDGSTVSVPSLNNDGSATVVNLTTPVTTTSVQLTVSTVSGTTQNVGLAEIQVFPPAT